MMRNDCMLCLMTMLSVAGFGCTPEGQTARVSSLTGRQSAGLTVTAAQDGYYTVHDLRTQEEQDRLIVSGHVGPATRLPNGPTGHVDIDLVSADGELLSSTSTSLDAVSASPRVFVERRFSAVINNKPEPGAQVRVTYHPGNALCHTGQ